MNRRAALGALGMAATASLAGCVGRLRGNWSDGESDGTGNASTGEGAPDLPLVEDPPEAVYVPTHREGMIMPSPMMAGEVMVAPMVTYPHPFWLVSGDSVELVEVTERDDVHLMVTVWDPETGTVLPTDEGILIEVFKDGTLVDSRAPWPMLSQTMGAHVGDNVPLDGYGTYVVEVRRAPIQTRRTGALAGRFEDHASAVFEFTYDREFLETVVGMIEWVDEAHWGVPGAIEPGHGSHNGHDNGDSGSHHDDDDDEHDDHGHDDGHDEHHHDDGHDDGNDHTHDHHRIPFSAVPPVEELPGTHQGTEISGDADFVVSVVDSDDRFGGDQYLLVSPRTPYNRVPLPDMALSAEITRNDDPVVETSLLPALDDLAGHHYGRQLSEIEPGDDLRLIVETPPQTARHQGYETAFVEMPPMEMSLDGW